MTSDPVKKLYKNLRNGFTFMDHIVFTKETEYDRRKLKKRATPFTFYVIAPRESPFSGKFYEFNLMKNKSAVHKIGCANPDSIVSFNISNIDINNCKVVLFEFGVFGFDLWDAKEMNSSDIYMNAVKRLIRNTFVDGGLTSGRLISVVAAWDKVENLNLKQFIDSIVSAKQKAPDLNDEIEKLIPTSARSLIFKDSHDLDSDKSDDNVRFIMSEMQYNATLDFLHSIFCHVNRVSKDVFSDVFIPYFGDKIWNTVKYYDYYFRLKELLIERQREWAELKKTKQMNGMDQIERVLSEYRPRMRTYLDKKITINLINADDHSARMELEADPRFDVYYVRNYICLLDMVTQLEVLKIRSPNQCEFTQVYDFSLFAKGKRLVIGNKLESYGIQNGDSVMFSLCQAGPF